MLEETALIPYLGTFVRLLGAIPIPEGPNSLRRLDSAARTALRYTGFIHFFPEGELYRENQDLCPFHPGAFLLACRLGVPVVPVTTVLHQRLWRGKGTVTHRRALLSPAAAHHHRHRRAGAPAGRRARGASRARA